MDQMDEDTRGQRNMSVTANENADEWLVQVAF
jgi:hypothetical protein